MRSSLLFGSALLATAAIAAVSCKTTYTPADIVAEEDRRDAEERAEERRADELGRVGGANREAFDEAAEQVEHETDR